MVLSYDSAGNAFTGKVENTTSDKLDLVRVEVHLSNGIELGPTTPVDLAPGQTVEVTLQASSQPFVSWSAHPEVGSSGGSNAESLEHASLPEGGDEEKDDQDRTHEDDRDAGREHDGTKMGTMTTVTMIRTRGGIAWQHTSLEMFTPNSSTLSTRGTWRL